MPSSSIITILSLLALSTLSFTVVFGSHNFFLDTPTRDTLAHDSQFSLPKSNVVHKRRALHPARATTPVPASGSNSPQSNPTPSQSAPSTPDANTQASSAAPFSSPSPSSSAQPSPTQDNSSAPSPSRAASTSPGTSAASAAASASALSSSAPALSSSSFSNVQASSSSGFIRSTVGATSNIANTPITTFGNNPISTSGLSGPHPTESGSTISSGATASAGAASAFFNNKAAVGATFSIVGIVGGLAVIMAVLTLTKRRRRARYLIEDEEFFEKNYPSAEPHLPPGFGSGSAEPSVTDFNMSAAPADAYPDRAVHYGQSNAGAVLNPVDYGIAYPPGAANNNDSTPADTNGNTYEDTESEYSMPSGSGSGSHPFADPANTSGPSAAPPVTYSRPIPGRVQEMVTTDSYYGPNSAGLGAGVGYAQ